MITKFKKFEDFNPEPEITSPNVEDYEYYVNTEEEGPKSVMATTIEEAQIKLTHLGLNPKLSEIKKVGKNEELKKD